MGYLLGSGAVISTCGVYRYSLTRIWDQTRGRVLFIMLNPSTADAAQDDPTIRRCLGFARDWGFGALQVVNLYALRATDPRELRQHPDPVGPENRRHILGAAGASDLLIAAWGGNPFAEEPGGEVCRMIQEEAKRPLFCLGRTVSGAPRHPLYLPKTVTMKAYEGGDL